jgi:hypothetical protein
VRVGSARLDTLKTGAADHRGEKLLAHPSVETAKISRVRRTADQRLDPVAATRVAVVGSLGIEPRVFACRASTAGRASEKLQQDPSAGSNKVSRRTPFLEACRDRAAGSVLLKLWWCRNERRLPSGSLRRRKGNPVTAASYVPSSMASEVRATIRIARRFATSFFRDVVKRASSLGTSAHVSARTQRCLP